MRFDPNISSTIIRGIDQSESRVQVALQQLSTQQRVNLPSDDPAASAALVQSLNEYADVDQYTANAETTLSQAQSADSALTSVVSLLNQAVTVGTEGATSTTSAAQQQMSAVQVEGILASVVSEANTTFQGVSVFGGTTSGSAAFVADAASTTGYTYKGDSGINSVAVGDALSVQVNLSGSTVFEGTGGNVLSALSSLASALKSGNGIGAATAAVSTTLEYVSQQHVVYGTTINQITTQESYLAQEKVTLQSQQTALVGIDPAVAAENLSQAELDNTAVLTAAAKVLPTTLLTYLQ